MTKPGMVEAGCVTFVAVAIGGSVFFFVRGTLRSSSEGCRLAGGIQSAVANAPRVRRWAAWRGVVTALRAGMEHVHHVQGPLKMAVAWGAANAVFSMHRGTRAAVREGLKGAAYGGAACIAIRGLGALVDSRESSRA
ncbi:mitochondrial import inner membrane translocase subunit TIM17-2-like [Lolium perenne]|uniref:mitochondrial import inner membrane translocase subunit TIM17-2-like n=1 Tax=Lolium perenne TaxID=4522 RepID=UPI0021F5B0DB|nr:mitochondrial import inner membrane translocase subunit TIM17-2-like [Lolium perenne]